jgi:hypothetical protein
MIGSFRCVISVQAEYCNGGHESIGFEGGETATGNRSARRFAGATAALIARPMHCIGETHADLISSIWKLLLSGCIAGRNFALNDNQVGA